MNRRSVSPPAVPPGGSPADKRHFGASTDDAAIFLEDTMDRSTAQCISTSPSALAILSPQRAPACTDHVDLTEYDAAHIGSARKSGSGGSALHDMTSMSTAAVRLNFGKSPTPKMNRLHSSSLSRSAQRRASQSGSRHPHSHSAARPSGTAFTPASKSSVSGMMTPGQPEELAEPVVPWSDYARLERERNRYQKMYEHQKVLYEEMSEKHADTYQKLQDRIVEVVALSTRNEESKRFIRQLKKEMSESRTRVMNMQNRVLEEQRADRLDRGRYESLLEERDRKYDRMVERHEAKMAGLESLVKDLTCINDEHGALHVAQLDALLRASYSKSTALFSDLLRQGRQIDHFYDSKAELELQLDELRREKREMEASMAEERRHMMYQTERFIEQIESQQQSILSLRQMLIRTMECVEEDDGEMGSFGSRSSSFHSMSDEEEYAAEEVGSDFINSAQTARGGDGVASEPLVSNSGVRPGSAAHGVKSGSAKLDAKSVSKSPATAAKSGERDSRPPTFLAERERNRPLLTSVVHQGAEDGERTSMKAVAKPEPGAPVEDGEDLEGRTSAREGSGAPADSAPTALSRRSHGRPSSGGAKSTASFIATAGTRRSSTGSTTSSSSTAAAAPKKVRAGSPARSSEGGSTSLSTVSMVRRKSNGLFAAPAEKTARDESSGTQPGSASAAQTRSSAKRLDFSTALAAVAEIRERTRQARLSTERPDDAPEANKENANAVRRPLATVTTAPITTTKRNAGVKEASKGTARTVHRDHDDEDDEDDAPRLTPHSRTRVNSDNTASVPTVKKISTTAVS